jgi:hypothetical protein
MRPRAVLDRFVGQHAEGWDDVFLEVLVLVIAPDDHQLGGEVVEEPAGLSKPRQNKFSMSSGGALPFVLAPFPSHRLRPSVGAA